MAELDKHIVVIDADIGVLQSKLAQAKRDHPAGHVTRPNGQVRSAKPGVKQVDGLSKSNRG